MHSIDGIIHTFFILWSGPRVLISYNTLMNPILYIPGCPQWQQLRRFQGQPNFSVWGRQRNGCVKPCGAQRTAGGLVGLFVDKAIFFQPVLLPCLVATNNPSSPPVGTLPYSKVLSWLPCRIFLLKWSFQSFGATKNGVTPPTASPFWKPILWSFCPKVYGIPIWKSPLHQQEEFLPELPLDTLGQLERGSKGKKTGFVWKVDTRFLSNGWRGRWFWGLVIWRILMPPWDENY